MWTILFTFKYIEGYLVILNGIWETQSLMQWGLSWHLPRLSSETILNTPLDWAEQWRTQALFTWKLCWQHLQLYIHDALWGFCCHSYSVLLEHWFRESSTQCMWSGGAPCWRHCFHHIKLPSMERALWADLWLWQSPSSCLFSVFIDIAGWEDIDAFLAWFQWGHYFHPIFFLEQ